MSPRTVGAFCYSLLPLMMFFDAFVGAVSPRANSASPSCCTLVFVVPKTLTPETSHRFWMVQFNPEAAKDPKMESLRDRSADGNKNRPSQIPCPIFHSLRCHHPLSRQEWLKGQCHRIARYNCFRYLIRCRKFFSHKFYTSPNCLTGSLIFGSKNPLSLQVRFGHKVTCWIFLFKIPNRSVSHGTVESQDFKF